MRSFKQDKKESNYIKFCLELPVFISLRLMFHNNTWARMINPYSTNINYKTNQIRLTNFYEFSIIQAYSWSSRFHWNSTRRWIQESRLGTTRAAVVFTGWIINSSLGSELRNKGWKANSIKRLLHGWFNHSKYLYVNSNYILGHFGTPSINSKKFASAPLHSYHHHCLYLLASLRIHLVILIVAARYFRLQNQSPIQSQFAIVMFAYWLTFDFSLMFKRVYYHVC